MSFYFGFFFQHPCVRTSGISSWLLRLHIFIDYAVNNYYIHYHKFICAIHYVIKEACWHVWWPVFWYIDSLLIRMAHKIRFKERYSSYNPTCFLSLSEVIRHFYLKHRSDRKIDCCNWYLRPDAFYNPRWGLTFIQVLKESQIL